MEVGKLYLVATPIGNLDDITLRAIKTLQGVDIIAAEDTRHSLKLLNHLDISKPLISYHRHNEEIKTKELIEKLKGGQNIALITDAGTPGISDPGEEIVKESIKNKIDIIPIPGACAAINALITSGLNTKQFSFYGFLSLNKKLRECEFEDIKNQNKTIILYEAPHRLKETLKEIEKRFGNIYIVVAKEITKIHETFFRGYISTILEEFQEQDIKGEYIIMFENKKEVDNMQSIEKQPIEKQYEYYKNNNMEKKEIIKQIAKNMKVPKDDIYKRFIEKNN